MFSAISNSQPKVRALFFILCAFLLVKVAFTLLTLVAADEAYYWVWGQDLALSYFDHPPLNAWLIALTSYFFDNSVFAMRLPTFLTFGGSVYIYWLFAKRLFPDTALYAFLLSTTAFLASPTLFVWTSIVYNDHLLIFLCLAATYAFADYFAAFQEDPNASTKPLYAGAIILGVAALAKYNAAFLGFSVAMLVIGHPKLRSLLIRPHIFLAGILCIAMLAPVLVWNIQNQFASFELHLVDRYDHALFTIFRPAPFYRYILSTLIYFGPVLVVPLVLLYMPIKGLDNFGRMTIWLARLTIASTLVTFVALSSRGAVHWYWGSVAYALMLPFLPLLLKKLWLFAIHFAFGLVFAIYATFNYSYAPVEILLGSQSEEVARVFGWDEAGEIATTLNAAHPGTFLATTGYPTAGQLAHHLGKTVVYDLDPRPSHFSFVGRKTLPTGSDAIVLHDKFGNLDGTKKRFESFELLTTYTYEIENVEINSFQFYLAKGFIGVPKQQ